MYWFIWALYKLTFSLLCIYFDSKVYTYNTCIFTHVHNLSRVVIQNRNDLIYSGSRCNKNIYTEIVVLNTSTTFTKHALQLITISLHPNSNTRGDRSPPSPRLLNITAFSHEAVVCCSRKLGSRCFLFSVNLVFQIHPQGVLGMFFVVQILPTPRCLEAKGKMYMEKVS